MPHKIFYKYIFLSDFMEKAMFFTLFVCFDKYGKLTVHGFFFKLCC